jgi:hypothetical protein
MRLPYEIAAVLRDNPGNLQSLFARNGRHTPAQARQAHHGQSMNPSLDDELAQNRRQHRSTARRKPVDAGGHKAQQGHAELSRRRRQQTGWTPLHHAASSQLAIISLLLTNMPTSTWCSPNGTTPLMMAREIALAKPWTCCWPACRCAR